MLTTPTVPHTNQSARGQRVSCHPGDLRAAKVKAGSLNSLTVQSGADKSDVGLENILTHKQDRKYRRKFGLTGGKLAIVGWFFTPLESNPASDRRASGGRDETRYQVGSSPLWSQILLRTGVPLEEERKLDIRFLQGPAEAGLALPAMVMPTEVPEDPATHHIRNTSRSFTHKEAEVPVTEASGAPVPLIKQHEQHIPNHLAPHTVQV
ncbi:uncharacterized protein [Pleurodeles waltl]|uniref:uncharacterized protein n=1 Tax=Pleurodeles waltl TaxID=8319 RepID=UPI0037099E84